MTLPVPAPRPRPPLPAASVRARAPQQTPAGQGAGVDRLALSDQAAIQWARSAFMSIPRLQRAELEALGAEAARKAATPGLGQEARGILFLARSGALGQLALKKVDRKANGQASFQALEQAVALAPADRDVVQAYSRAMFAIAERNFFVRKIVTSVLDLDLKAALRASVTLLAQFPDDPTSQAVRVRVADKVGDKRAKAEAQAHLDRMAKHAPRAVAEALRKLDGDKGLAQAAEKDVK